VFNFSVLFIKNEIELSVPSAMFIEGVSTAEAFIVDWGFWTANYFFISIFLYKACKFSCSSPFEILLYASSAFYYNSCLGTDFSLITNLLLVVYMSELFTPLILYSLICAYLC